MKVLITGAGGFIGSHLVECCVALNYQVKAFVRYNSKNDWGWLEALPIKNDIEVISGDIRDYDSVSKAVKGADIVFHLAALIGIPYSYISPKAYIETNVVGTYNVLEAAKVLGIPQVLSTSTSETYGTAQYVPIDEKHPLVGQSPYSASKIGADQLAVSYFCSFDLPVKIVRPFNAYGPRQSARAVIPSIIIQLMAGEKKLKLGNLHPTRDFTFVEDTANGFIEISKTDSLKGEVTNIGTHTEISIRDLVHLIAELMEVEVRVSEDKDRVRPDKSEVERLVCDHTKITKNTKWKPKHDLKQGLIKTIDFISKHKELYKDDIYNV